MGGLFAGGGRIAPVGGWQSGGFRIEAMLVLPWEAPSLRTTG